MYPIESEFGMLFLAASQRDIPPMITNDAVIFGILMMIVAFVFYTANSKHPALQRFYKFVPLVLLCYLLPSFLTLFNVVDPTQSNLYFVATRYFLPASLVLLVISVDLHGVFRLGPKALIMFITGTIGVIAGGPIAVLIVAQFDPQLVGGSGPDAVWRGMSTVAGSWIGGSANQLAMKEIWMSDEFRNEALFTVMLAIDVIVAEVWMLFLLLGVGQAKSIDRLFKADASSVDELQQKMEAFTLKTARIPTTTELLLIGALAFGVTAYCHMVADGMSATFGGMIDRATDPDQVAWMRNFSLNKEFFWIIVMATTVGLILSFTRARNLEGAGASKVGTVFIFLLVAVIGMGMDIRAIVEHRGLFMVGGIWMLFHVGLMFLVAYLIKAPYFFLAVGSKANIGGAASAPVVAAAFHPSLAPVGVLLAVLGYVLGTYGAYFCALMMRSVAPV